ncbi:MAG: type IV secretion system DNA-binding domain-containing protein [Campylobacterales bacterium]|nr:type IV secretion system DNA-binding domain-containing protein [Campylobacterales bacterium]
MFDGDLLLAFLFMVLLFLRQLSILKQPNKIDYAPLMVGIGAISSIVHFIVHPETQDLILLLRESSFPLLVSLLLYIVMNVLHQTQQTESARAQDDFTRVLVSQVTQLKEFMADLEARIIISQQEDRKVQEEVRGKFNDDIRALDAIKINQGKFLEKFENMDDWHKNVSKEFEKFVNVKMPSLDEVVHNHIDILRVAEQEHYNQLKTMMEKSAENRYDASKDINELKISLNSMKNLSDEVAKTVTKHTLQQLSGVTQEFASQIISLKSHTESVKTSLNEGESTLASIRQQSEIIMKQMLLSSNRMSDIEAQSNTIHNAYATMKELIRDIEIIRADYAKSKAELSIISKELKVSEGESMDAMKNQIESLSVSLVQKIDEALLRFNENYHIIDDEISQSVQFLAKRSQIKHGYTQS